LSRRSLIFCFYTESVTTNNFEIKIILFKKLFHLFVHIMKGVGDLCIDALILVSGCHSKHREAWGHALLQADPVHFLAEHRGIIVGIGDLDLDLGAAALGWVPTVHSC
uniref:Uncharacterized protein n=1 Tax=Equus asinus TaxID=9793 RepID=A0A8C4MH69_EQUAS